MSVLQHGLYTYLHTLDNVYINYGAVWPKTAAMEHQLATDRIMHGPCLATGAQGIGRAIKPLQR